MAKLTSLFPFSGSLDGFTVYTIDGIKHPIIRRREGPPGKSLNRLPPAPTTEEQAVNLAAAPSHQD